MQRGYFDDFRDFRDSKGKVFHATERLAPASHVRFARCACGHAACYVTATEACLLVCCLWACITGMCGHAGCFMLAGMCA